jgi:gluconokinase
MSGDQSPPAGTSALRVVVMGVSGAGKTTVGELLAARLDVPYADADEFHPPANVAKMSAGTPLTDDDRWPWLDAIGRWLDQQRAGGAVVTCSALRRTHRDALRAHVADLWFLHCAGSFELIQQRITRRAHHFMPASLLRSQFETLEPPGADERAVSEDVGRQPAEMVADFLATIARRTADERRTDS